MKKKYTGSDMRRKRSKCFVRAALITVLGSILLAHMIYVVYAFTWTSRAGIASGACLGGAIVSSWLDFFLWSKRLNTYYTNAWTQENILRAFAGQARTAPEHDDMYQTVYQILHRGAGVGPYAQDMFQRPPFTTRVGMSGVKKLCDRTFLVERNGFLFWTSAAKHFVAENNAPPSTWQARVASSHSS